MNEKQKIKKIEKCIVKILTIIGENPDREGLINTPNRVARMFTKIYEGYDETKKPKITVFDNGKDGILYNEMVIDKGYFYSQCEHHMVPFFGEYYFAYIPDKKVLGISKVARIIDFYSAKLQVQERLVQEVVNEINEQVKPKGIALVMIARHLCKESRGVKKYNSTMTCSCIKGVFCDNNAARKEFLDLIKMK